MSAGKDKRRTSMRYALLLAVVLAACSHSSGGDAPPINAFPQAQPQLSIDMRGTWEMTMWRIVETDTPVTSKGRIGSNMHLTLTRVVSNPPGQMTLVGLVNGLRTSLSWYANNVTPKTVDFGYGYDNLAGGFEGRTDFLNYALRLVGIGPGELMGFEVLERQNSPEARRTRWVAQVWWNKVQ